MDAWENMTAKKAFITDLGEETEQTGLKFCRFAVWLPEKEEAKHRIAEVGNDLENLKKKYAVEAEYVFRVKSERAESA